MLTAVGLGVSLAVTLKTGASGESSPIVMANRPIREDQFHLRTLALIDFLLI
jgi:hypothetical protein